MAADNAQLSRLVEKATAGDTEAFSEIVRLTQNVVVGYAWSLLRDYARAEDAAQEAFLEAYLHLRDLREPSAFGPWIRAVTFSRCQRILRRPRPETAAADDALDHGPHSAVELRRDLSRAVHALPEPERAVVVLFYAADLDQRQISEFLEIPISTIKNRLLSARQHLKEQLMSDFEDELRAQRPSRAPSFERRVAWFRAVDQGDADAVARLLAEDPKLVRERRRRDEQPPPGVRWGVTALHLAARHGQLAVAKILIDAGADLEARSSGHDDEPGGGTPLHWAAKFDQLEIVKLLVERGADVNPAEDSSDGPRFGGAGATLSLFHHRAIAEYLIAHGARITIFAAVALGLASKVRELVSEDPARLSSREFVDFTPLHLAARDDLPEMVDLLCELGAPLGEKDRLDRSPIDVALLAGRTKAFERLSAHGAAPSLAALDIVSDIVRAERLNRFFTACLNDLVEVGRMLEEEPALANAKLPGFWTDNYVGGTALHLAAALGKHDLAALLLRRGADRGLKDERYGGTPGGWAQEFDRPATAAFLDSWPNPPPESA